MEINFPFDRKKIAGTLKYFKKKWFFAHMLAYS